MAVTAPSARKITVPSRTVLSVLIEFLLCACLAHSLLSGPFVGPLPGRNPLRSSDGFVIPDIVLRQNGDALGPSRGRPGDLLPGNRSGNVGFGVMARNLPTSPV